MSESTWLERFYTHFLGRDLAYTFAGGLFIGVVQYALFHTIFMPRDLSLELIGFILSSYFLGSVIRDIGVTVFPHLIYKDSPDYTDSLIFYQDLITNYDSRILDKYERIVYYLAICSSVGTSSLLGGIFMGIVGLYRLIFQATYSINYIGFALSLVLLGFFMIYRGKEAAGTLEGHITALAKDISSKN